jgi:hypothetical protein
MPTRSRRRSSRDEHGPSVGLCARCSLQPPRAKGPIVCVLVGQVSKACVLAVEAERDGARAGVALFAIITCASRVKACAAVDLARQSSRGPRARACRPRAPSASPREPRRTAKSRRRVDALTAPRSRRPSATSVSTMRATEAWGCSSRMPTTRALCSSVSSRARPLTLRGLGRSASRPPSRNA